MNQIISFIAGTLVPVVLGYIVVKFKPEFVFSKLVELVIQKYDERMQNELTNYIGFWMVDSGLWLLRRIDDDEETKFIVIKLLALKEQLRAKLRIPQE